MSQSLYSTICAMVFLVVAVGHLARLLFGWEIQIGHWSPPTWVSIVGLIIPAFLSAWGFRLASRSRRTV
jgi:hypothetical protein